MTSVNRIRRNMSAPTTIQACMIDRHIGPEEICDIETVTKPPYLPPTCPPDLNEREFHEKLWRNPRHTHVCYLINISKNCILYELPTTQPECPKEWTSEDRANRSVLGFNQFHIFMPAPNAGDRLSRPFICRVTNRVETEPVGNKWHYENIGTESAELREELKSWWSMVSYWLHLSGSFEGGLITE